MNTAPNNAQLPGRSKRTDDAPKMAEPSPVNPYRGLRPYTAVDAANYYGRTRLVQHVLSCLLGRWRQGPRFLAVLGPSGSGKTSLVCAGLWPELRRLDGAS